MDKSIIKEPEGKKKVSVYANCDHCGYPIYTADEAIIIKENEEIIHKECWYDYSVEHLFYFAMPATASESSEII